MSHAAPNGLQPGKPRVLVGMSGGVDSSVAAALLVEQGFDVTGGFIKNWSDSHDLWTGECQWRGERRDAIRVAARLGISLLTFDFEQVYRSRVVDRMFQEYARCITPNPDVLCNEEIKFGLFFEAAMRLGFDYVATGHYAQTKDGRLMKAVDADKDQSYFLHRVSHDVLRRTLFPIGGYVKSDVRRMADVRRLPTATKPDSQGICFVGKIDMKEFLRKKIEPTPGEIVTPEGEVIGHHDGLDVYTIGQRQGIGVSKDGRTWYVAEKDRARNRLIVVPDREHPLLYKQNAFLENVHWIHEPASLEVEVAIRYHAPMVRARLIKRLKGWSLEFIEPVWALAPGQSAVIYQGDECLGGGFLAEEPPVG